MRKKPSQLARAPLAQELEASGFVEQLGRRFAAQRQEADRQALDESRGYSVESIGRSVGSFFSRPGGLLGDAGRLSQEEREAAGRAELETAQITAPRMRGVASQYGVMAENRRIDPRARAMMPPGEIGGPTSRFGNGDAADATLDFWRRTYSASATHQEERLARAQQMARGEVDLPEFAQWRSLFDTGVRQIPDLLAAMPLQMAGIISGYVTGGEPTDTALFRWGQEVERIAQQAFPGDRARQYEFAHLLAQGVASTAVFGGQQAVASLLGAGARGQLALIALTGASAETPREYLRVTEALRNGSATERERLIVLLANAALGSGEALPFAGGRTRAGLGARLSHGAVQGLEEVAQESAQTIGSNVARQSYVLDQDAF